MLAFLRKIRRRTLLLCVVSPFVGLYVTYLVLVNALLWTGIGKAAINHAAPEHVHVEWRSAYSVSPMRVHTKGFAIRGEDSSVQWLITTERANATFGPFDFFSRRVRLHGVWASGLAMRIRFKLKPAEVTPDRVAALPTIAGFSDPPLAPAVSPPPAATYRLWSVAIDDAVVADVREVWVDTIRVTASGGHVEGGFLFEPERRVSVSPTYSGVEDASVVDGKHAIARNLHGTFSLRIAELDMRYVRGAEVLGHIDGTASGNAQVGDLVFLDRWLHSAHVAVAGGAGPTTFSVAVEEGRLVCGSRAWMRADGWSLWSGHDGLSGTSEVTAVVPDGEPRLTIAVETSGLGVHRGKTRVAHAPSASASARIDNLDMARPFDRWAASVDVPSATASDLRALDAYLDSPMLRGGSATMKAHAELAPHHLSGHATIDVSRAVVDIRKTTVTASGTFDATLHHFDLRSGKGDLAGARIDLHDVSGAGQRGWWANFSVNPLSIDLAHGFGFSGAVTGKLANGQLPLAILDAPGIVRTVFGSQGFTMATQARYAHGRTDLTDLRVIGNTVEVRAQLRDGDGAVLVETPFINVGLVIRDGDTSTHLFATRDWYARMLDTKAQID